MDAFQGTVLNLKLPHLDAWNNARRALADRYHSSICAGKPQPPLEQSWARSVFHIFAVRTLHREAAIAEFRLRGIETRIHYPVPIHLMDRFKDLCYAEGSFPEAEKAADEVLSIPIYPELTNSEVDTITDSLREISLTTQVRTAQQA
jgi:dTDP-4-amino-4,6-dideoxygalactose transaminase